MAFWSQKSRATDKAGVEIKRGAQPQRSTTPQPVPTTKTSELSDAKGFGKTSDSKGGVPQDAGDPTSSSLQASQSPTPNDLSASEVQIRVAASKHNLMALGEIVSIMMRTRQYRSLTLASVETLVAPAVNSGQFLVAEAQSSENGSVTPIAMVLWASVSSDVDRRLSENLEQPVSLAPNEWKTGDVPWLMAAAGDGRIVNEMIKQLQDKSLKGRPFRIRVRGKDGKDAVGTFQPQRESTNYRDPVRLR
jgi:cytolysin-activating lysine-acyltransferase